MGKCQVHVKVGEYKYKHNIGSEREFLNGPMGKQAATKAAQAVLASANAIGSGRYGISTAQAGKNRAHALVFTADGKSMKDNAEKNTLLRALHGANV